MDEIATRETEASDKAAQAASLRDRLRAHAKGVAAIIASIAAVGAVASGLLGYWSVWKTIRTDVIGGKQRATAEGPVVSQGPSVAVLSFANASGDATKDRIADELTEDFIAGLGKFKSLRVFSRGAVAGFKTQLTAATSVRAALGVDYVVEAVLRGGDKFRLLVQLSDARSGQQVWTRSFDVVAGSEALNVEQVAGRAAAMIGSNYGAIGFAEYQNFKDTPANELTPYQCIITISTAFGASQWSAALVTKERACAEHLVRSQPRNAAAWAALSFIYINQRWWGLGLPSDEANNIDKRAYLLDKNREAASRAVELDPNDPYTRRQMAFAYIFSCNRDAGLIESQRAMELNPNDPTLPAYLGNWLTYMGDLDQGVKMVEDAIATSGSGFPQWWWSAMAARGFARSDYDEALDAARKTYVDQFWNSHLLMAYILEAAGKGAEAKAHIATLLKLKPGFTIRDAKAYYKMWCFPESYRDKMGGFLKSAGLPD